MMNHNVRTTECVAPGRRGGAVMSEMVLIMPLILVILVLLLYFGKLMVRAEHDSVLARYETWRQVAGAPGPGHDEDRQHPHLNTTFFGGKATHLNGWSDDAEFPSQPYDRMIDHAGNSGGDAKNLTQSLLYRAGNKHRYSNGRSAGYSVYYQNTADAWDRLNAIGPRGGTNPEAARRIGRSHLRIGTDWSYTNSWTASAGTWTGGGHDVNHPRGVRDGFFEDFDRGLDNVDGQADNEYGDSAEPQVPADSLAGMVRRMYLEAPGYGGPTVR